MTNQNCFPVPLNQRLWHFTQFPGPFKKEPRTITHSCKDAGIAVCIAEIPQVLVLGGLLPAPDHKAVHPPVEEGTRN